MRDAVILLRHIARIELMDFDGIIIMDANNDAVIDLKDASSVLSHVAKVELLD